ncbi:MAG: hypothetical protein H0W15_04320 [Gemmatimonadales bacterium]|nr:hypothetical protein [Gemmatimonadales bacterium]
MTSRRRGVALLLVLGAVVLLQGLVVAALWMAIHDVRAVGAVRLAIEGEMVAATALAETRMSGDSLMRQLGDGVEVMLPDVQRGGWRVRMTAIRRDSLIGLTAAAELRTSADSLLGAATRTLVLSLGASDTLLVLRGRSRF